MTVPEYLNVAVAGVPLVAVVMGLTFLAGKFGATGKLQLGISVVIGFILGLGYMLINGVPVDYAGWFTAVIFAFAMALLPAGIYETFKEAVAHVK